MIFVAVYVDASDACHKIAFDISPADSSTRTWDIKVTQYECGAEDGGEKKTNVS